MSPKRHGVHWVLNTAPSCCLWEGKIAPSPVAVALGTLLVLCSAEAAANPAQQKSCGCFRELSIQGKLHHPLPGTGSLSSQVAF